MAWTAPRTWVVGEVLTAALLNTHLRDNLLETAVAKVTTAGDIVQATAANTLARLGMSGAALKFLRANAGATALEYAAATPTLVGSVTSEQTSTTATPVDIATVSGLSIAALTPLFVVVKVRKSAGAAAQSVIGLKINTTVVYEATANIGLWQTSATDRAEDGAIGFFIAPRAANHINPVAGFLAQSRVSSSRAIADVNNAPIGTAAADFPTATITDLIIRGASGNAAITLGVLSVHVFA